MNTDEVEELHQARRTLVLMRRTLARDLARLDVAPIELATGLREVLATIEAVDRALADAGHPFLEDERRS